MPLRNTVRNCKESMAGTVSVGCRGSTRCVDSTLPQFAQLCQYPTLDRIQSRLKFRDDECICYYLFQTRNVNNLEDTWET